MAYEVVNETHYRKVRAMPDDDTPQAWPWPAAVTATWITPELIEEVLYG